MINKRLLIKNLLAYNDENSFFDRKRQLNLHSKEGKAKFLKHISALSNSNPSNNSFIVVGVEDDNEIVGDDFFDDSRIQNLVNAVLENPPLISYENIPFPKLPKDKVIGLVTIQPNPKITSFKKSLGGILSGSTFIRIGSNSIPVENPNFEINYQNAQIVSDIEKNSRNSIEHTLGAVMDFVTNKHKSIKTEYKVFKEVFVICWAGIEKKMRDKTLWSRVDIELINEQVKLFYSTLDEVQISYDNDSFTIVEYIPLGLNDKTSYYPLEKLTIDFFDNGYYKMNTEMLFEPPQYNKRLLFHIYNSSLNLIKKTENGQPLTPREIEDLENLPPTLLICYLNGFEEAMDYLVSAKTYLKTNAPTAYTTFKEVMRVLRKIKY